MSAMLEVRGLEVNYGHIEAVRGIDLDLNANEITALVGANGAGKSTTLLALSGPMVILFFLAVLIGWLVQRRRPAEA